MRGTLKIFTQDSNHVLLWLKDRTHEGIRMDDPEHTFKANGGNISALLYADYADWAKTMGFKQMSVVAWGTKLKQIGVPSVARRHAGSVHKMRDLHLVSNVGF
jgi:phage/plasmid-associated DNA primase